MHQCPFGKSGRTFVSFSAPHCTILTWMPFIVRISYLPCSKKLSNGPRKHKFGRDYHPEHQSKPIPSRLPLVQRRYIRMDRSPGANDGRRNAAPDNIKHSVTATSSRAACRRASTAYGDQKQKDEHFFRGIRGVLWCFWLSFYTSLVRWHHHCY